MRVGSRKLKKVLSSCAIDPKKDELFQPVLENIEQYPQYALLKAVEIIKDQQRGNTCGTVFIKQAITLLAYWVALDESNEVSAQKRA